MRTVKEIRELSNSSVISSIYYMGILMSNQKPVKKWDRELERLCKECERRGFVESAEELYQKVCK